MFFSLLAFRNVFFLPNLYRQELEQNANNVEFRRNDVAYGDGTVGRVCGLECCMGLVVLLLMVVRFCCNFFVVVLGHTDQKIEAFSRGLEGNTAGRKVCFALGSAVVSWGYCWR